MLALFQNLKMDSYLVFPLLVQIIYQPILVFVPPSSPPVFLTERDAAVASAGGHEARAGGRDYDKHILSCVSPPFLNLVLCVPRIVYSQQ